MLLATDGEVKYPKFWNSLRATKPESGDLRQVVILEVFPRWVSELAGIAARDIRGNLDGLMIQADSIIYTEPLDLDGAAMNLAGAISEYVSNKRPGYQKLTGLFCYPHAIRQAGAAMQIIERASAESLSDALEAAAEMLGYVVVSEGLALKEGVDGLLEAVKSKGANLPDAERIIWRGIRRGQRDCIGYDTWRPSDPLEVGQARRLKRCASLPDDAEFVDREDALYTVRSFIYDSYWSREYNVKILWNYRGEWYIYRDGCYRKQDPAVIRAKLQDYLDRRRTWAYTKTKERIPGDQYKPSAHQVDGLLKTLASECLAPDKDVPFWVGEDITYCPCLTDIIPLANDLLDLSTGVMHSHTPKLFCTWETEYSYFTSCGDCPSWEPAKNPKENGRCTDLARCAPPKNFLAFLDSLWPVDKAIIDEFYHLPTERAEELIGFLGDEDATAIRTCLDNQRKRDLLQEWFSYCLTADNSQQKILALIGPKRSGKGTIGRVLAELIGKDHVAGLTTEGLSSQFGLATLVGKLLCIVSDARFRGPGAMSATERMLSISGGDRLSIPRKFLPDLTTILSARLMILSNELPRLADSSAAMASRFLVLELDRSFYGKEDPTLTDRLLAELPGILKWALEGRRRLQREGRFTEPCSSRDARGDMAKLGSPAQAFIADCCNTEDLAATVSTDKLYDVYRLWAEKVGQRPDSKAIFGRNLRAACPSIQKRRNQNTGTFYQSLEITDEWQQKLDAAELENSRLVHR